MKERLTQVLLLLVALALLLNMALPLVRPAAVKAGGLVHCSGHATVGAFGATETLTGGYDISFNCF